MANLTRNQLKEIRQKFKDKKSEDLAKELEANGPHDEESESLKKENKKDKLGLTREERKSIRTQKTKETVSVTWNVSVGDLVYLPDANVGLVVREDTTSKVSVRNLQKGKVKNALKSSSVSERVYVITSSGNKWYRPNSLKLVDM